MIETKTPVRTIKLPLYLPTAEETRYKTKLFQEYRSIAGVEHMLGKRDFKFAHKVDKLTDTLLEELELETVSQYIGGTTLWTHLQGSWAGGNIGDNHIPLEIYKVIKTSPVLENTQHVDTYIKYFYEKQRMKLEDRTWTLSIDKEDPPGFARAHSPKPNFKGKNQYTKVIILDEKSFEWYSVR